ncbi:MAG: HAD family hydrolase [Sphaerochaetaceae bacterium]|jgi:HAD superfamily hydrolase (TIGR01509 family)
MNQEKGKQHSRTEQKTLYMFDMGNVIIKNIDTSDAIIDYYNLSKQEFLADIAAYEYPLMEGVLSSQQYWQHVEHKFNITIEGDPLADFFNPTWNRPVKELVERLRNEGKRVICASNTVESHYQTLMNFGYFSLFEKVYASFAMGLTKPSRQFFEFILEKEEVEAHQVCFVDDLLENVLTAQTLGIATFHYAPTDNYETDERLKVFLLGSS